MQMNLYPFLAQLLVMTGAAVLALSLLLVRHLVNELPHGRAQARWHQLLLLIIVFITAYLAYAAVSWGHQQGWHDLIVPAVFFGGAVFVWLTARLALHTTAELQQLVRLEHENITDPLLGIYNRRYLDRRLQEECDRALRYKSPLSILMLDIDHFKKINDTFGHQIGDLALQHISKVVLDAVRHLDIVARYGGEELVVLAPDTTAPTAAELAKRLNHLVAATPLLLTDAQGGQQAIRMTVSMGVSSISYNVNSAQKLVQCADQALYEAKRNGRNQVVTCDNYLGE